MTDPLSDFVDPYPLHAKVRENRERLDIIGDFWDWAQHKGYHLVSYDPLGRDVPAPFIRDLLHDYLGIDQQAFEAEKLAMLEKLRAMNQRLTEVKRDLSEEEVGG